MASTAPSALQILTHLILLKILWGRLYDHSYFIDEEMEVQQQSNLLRFTQLVNSREQNWTQVIFFESLCS